MPEPTTNPEVQVYQFHVLLLQISPAIWRRFLIRSDSSIADLHYTLQIIMGWTDMHLHRFVLHGREYGISKPGGLWFDDDPAQIRLSDLHLRLKERFLYEYDFTDYWQHQLRLEQVLPLDPSKRYPFCLAGGWQAPPEVFDEVAAELGHALDHFKVPEREKQEVLAALVSHKAEVINSPR